MASEEDALAAAVRAELAVQAAQHGLSNFRSPDEDAEQLPAEVREELEQEVTASKEELVMFAGLRPGGDYDGIGGERAAPAVDTAAASSSSLAAAEEEAEREANRRDPLRRAHLEDFDEPSQLEDLGLEVGSVAAAHCLPCCPCPRPARTRNAAVIAHPHTRTPPQ